MQNLSPPHWKTADITPVFKNGKKGDLDMHVLAFEHWAVMKDMLEEDWEMFFPRKSKEIATEMALQVRTQKTANV